MTEPIHAPQAETRSHALRSAIAERPTPTPTFPPRSNSAAVRNPIAADPEVAAIIATLSPEACQALQGVLQALSRKWRAQGKRSWDKHKAPMACYHKANAINARHLALALKKRGTVC